MLLFGIAGIFLLLVLIFTLLHATGCYRKSKSMVDFMYMITAILAIFTYGANLALYISIGLFIN